MEKILLVSDQMIKEQTAIHGNIDPKLIYPDIKLAQDMYIYPLLGSALYAKLQAIVADGTIKSDPVNANYKILLDKFLNDAIIYYTLSELPTTISYQFWNKGVLRKTSDNTELPSMGDLIDISNKYKQRAEFYANQARKYIKQHAYEYFPEYLNPGTGLDTQRPEHSTFTMPVYLGGLDDDCGDSMGFYNQPYKG